MRFETLYGYVPTRAEWLEEQREHAAAGRFTVRDDGENPYVPWHSKWAVCRDGSWGYDGEWSSMDSWTCRKIIRPSYDRATAVYLVVRVRSTWFSGNRKARPTRWTAHVSFGEHSYYAGMLPLGPTRSCNSIISACRKAEKLPTVDAEVAKVLKYAYGARGCSAVFRKEGAEFLPFKTCFSFAPSPNDWERGQYLQTHWDTPYSGGQTLVKGSYVKTCMGGYSGGSYHESTTPGGPLNYSDLTAHHAMVEKLGCWIPVLESEQQLAR